MKRPDVKNFRWSTKMDQNIEMRGALKGAIGRSEKIAPALRRRITLPKALHTGDMSHEEFITLLYR